MQRNPHFWKCSMTENSRLTLKIRNASIPVKLRVHSNFGVTAGRKTQGPGIHLQALNLQKLQSRGKSTSPST